MAQVGRGKGVSIGAGELRGGEARAAIEGPVGVALQAPDKNTPGPDGVAVPLATSREGRGVACSGLTLENAFADGALEGLADAVAALAESR